MDESLHHELNFEKQKAHNEADDLTDVEMQEPPTITQNLTSVDQTSSVISDSVEKSAQDDDDVKMHNTENEKEHVLSPMMSTQVAYEPVTDSKSPQTINPAQKVAEKSETSSNFLKIKPETKEIRTYSKNIQGVSSYTNAALYTLNPDGDLVSVNSPTSVSSSAKMPLPQSHASVIQMPQTLIQGRKGKIISNLLREVARLKTRKAKLENDLIKEKKKKEADSSLLKTIAELTLEKAKLEKDLIKEKKKKEADSSLLKTIAELTLEKAKLEKDLFQQRDEKVKLQSNLFKEIDKVKKLVKVIIQQKESKRKGHPELFEKISRLKAEKAKIEKDEEEKSKVNSYLLSEINKLKNEVVQSKKEKGELENQYTVLKSLCADFQEQVKDLKIIVKARENAILFQQKYEYSVKDEMKNLKEALKKSKCEIIKAKSETFKVEKACEELKKQKKKLDSKFYILDKRIQDFQAKLSQYKTVTVDMKKQSVNSKQNSDIENCSEKIMSLESRLNEINEQMKERNLESETSSFSKVVQGQSSSNEKADRKLDTVLLRDSQRLNIPPKQDTKDVTVTRALHKLSQNTNTLQVSSSIPVATNTIQESSNFFKDSSATVVSQHNQLGIKVFQKTSDVNMDINTSLGIMYTTEDCSTTSTVSHDSYIQPLVFSTFQDLSTAKKLSNTVQYSVAKDKVQQPREFAKVPKKTSQPLPNIYGNQSLNTVVKQVSISGRKIIDLDYFFKMLKIVNKHSEFGCNLNDIVITNERKVGLIMFYYLKCRMCDYQITLCSESPSLEDNVNADALAGMLSINCNLNDFNKLLYTMKLPEVSENVFIREYDKKERENLPIVHSVCSENLEKSLEDTPQYAASQVSTFSEEIKTEKEAGENLTQQPKSCIDLISDSSGFDKSFQQDLSNRALIEDQFEVEEERTDSECAIKSEVILSQHILKVPNNKPVADEDHTLLNTTQIKQEIDLDMYEKELNKPETNEVKMLNNNNLEYMMIN